MNENSKLIINAYNNYLVIKTEIHIDTYMSRSEADAIKLKVCKIIDIFFKSELNHIIYSDEIKSRPY